MGRDQVFKDEVACAQIYEGTNQIQRLVMPARLYLFLRQGTDRIAERVVLLVQLVEG